MSGEGEADVLKTILIALCVITTSACSSYDVHRYGTIDTNEKTITVPSGGQSLKGKIKEMLQSEGWTLQVDRGPDVVQGTVGDNTHIEMSNTFNSRYRLRLTYDWYDVSIRFQDMYTYDISLIDNQSGSEVLTLSGNGEEDVIVDRLRKALRGEDVK